jgi:hypothetical protein
MVSATDMPGAVLHKSTNSGYNWSTVMTLNNSGLNIMYSLSSVYMKDGNTGFATGSHQLYSQTRAIFTVPPIQATIGLGWFNRHRRRNSIYCVHFETPDRFASGNGVIMRSTNGGANWEEQTSGTTLSLTAVFMQNA